MFERLIYTNSNGESIEFSPYSVYHTNVTRDVTGLAEFQAQHVTTQSIGQDGETWMAGRVKAKQITVRGAIKYVSRASTSACRQQMNHILNPKLSGTLTYVRDSFRRVIECHPSALPFSHSAALDEYNFTLDCPEPYWRAEAGTVSNITAWLKTWYWLNNDGEKATYITEGAFYFGQRQQGGYAIVENPGDAQVGGVFILSTDRGCGGPKITNMITGEYIRLSVVLLAGDEIRIDTRRGQKSVTRVRNGVSSDIFYVMDAGSTFMQLDVGENLYQLTCDSGVDRTEARVEFQPGYLGV